MILEWSDAWQADLLVSVDVPQSPSLGNARLVLSQPTIYGNLVAKKQHTENERAHDTAEEDGGQGKQVRLLLSLIHI